MAIWEPSIATRSLITYCYLCPTQGQLVLGHLLCYVCKYTDKSSIMTLCWLVGLPHDIDMFIYHWYINDKRLDNHIWACSHINHKTGACDKQMLQLWVAVQMGVIVKISIVVDHFCGKGMFTYVIYVEAHVGVWKWLGQIRFLLFVLSSSHPAHALHWINCWPLHSLSGRHKYFSCWPMSCHNKAIHDNKVEYWKWQFVHVWIVDLHVHEI